MRQDCGYYWDWEYGLVYAICLVGFGIDSLNEQGEEMKKISYEHGIVLGADPEFFLQPKRRKSIIGAEKVIDINKGLNVKSLYNHNKSAVICDGVQAELTIAPASCRAHVGNQIQECFKTLQYHLKTKDIVPCFKQTVKITKKEMTSLSPQSKIFGCSPSKNAWDNPPEIAISDLNPETYRFRSAGGHIHIGQFEYKVFKEWLHENIAEIIQLLDYLLGNTCVLLDIDPNQVQRRKTYGRAGEYRQQPWGLEYRTLSNFWLQHYVLMSFVMGLARETILLAKQKHAKQFFKLVPKEDIIQAINDNDFDLAKSNFDKLKPLICEIVPEHNGQYPLASDIMNEFEYVVKKGINHFFKEEPFYHWINKPEGHGTGWESFAVFTVRPEIKKQGENKNG